MASSEQVPRSCRFAAARPNQLPATPRSSCRQTPRELVLREHISLRERKVLPGGRRVLPV